MKTKQFRQICRLSALGRSRLGMTLVEIILAMAILGIVVVLLTPVMVSAFRMIILSGDRHEIAKNVAGQMEGVLAGNPITTTFGEVVIALPGGVTVNGRKFEINAGSEAYFVDLNGYEIESMVFVDPTGTGPTTSATTAAPTVDPTATTIATSATTAAPTAAPIDLTQLSIDVADWTNLHQYGVIKNTTNQMEYLLQKRTPGEILWTSVTGWTICTGLQTTMDLARNDLEYSVSVRQRDNVDNNTSFKIRSSPMVIFQIYDSKNTCFWIYDKGIGSFRPIVTADAVELRLAPGESWIRLTTGYKIKNVHLNRDTVYARLATTLSSDGTTVIDPPSLPYKLDA